MFAFLLELSRPQKRIFSVIADLVLLPCAFWLALVVRQESLVTQVSSAVLLSFLVSLPITLVAFVKLGLYRAVLRFMGNHALAAIVAGVTVSALSLNLAAFYLQAPLPRSVPFIYWCIALLFVGGSRMLVRSYLLHLQKPIKEKVIVYGAGSTGLQLLTALEQGGEFQAVAFVDDDQGKHGSTIQGKRIYSPSELPQLIKNKGAKRVLLALGRASHSQRSLILRFLEPMPVLVQTVPSMLDIVEGRAHISEVRDIEIEDLLGRDPVAPNKELFDACITNKVVMVTGAGGSIGSELCRQIVGEQPKCLILFELSEFGLYSIEQEILQMVYERCLNIDVKAIVGSVQKEHRLEVIMRTFGVQTVYHAAAYKHVPMVEHNIVEGVRNNVFGTWYAAEAAIKADVETFVLVSTDKAVRPTNVMGASKRMAELVLQGIASRQSKTRVCMVRFGNVLGSSGSVVPLFRKQIREGGPVTVTHPDIIRYFMTIPEAAQLVIQAGSMGSGGEVFVLDMGAPVKITDLARKMIHLMGLQVKDEKTPLGDIEVTFSGLRPGEKLYEELLIGDNPLGTEHSRIMKAQEICLSWNDVEKYLDELDRACHIFDCNRVRELLQRIPTGYVPGSGMEDLVWNSVKQKRQQLKEEASANNVVPIKNTEKALAV